MNNMTAHEVIAEERLDQLVKHGYTTQGDSLNYRKGQLLKVAMCIQTKEPHGWPEDWDRQYWEKFMSKDRKGQLAVAGALVMAHIDAFGGDTANNELVGDIVKELEQILNENNS